MCLAEEAEPARTDNHIEIFGGGGTLLIGDLGGGGKYTYLSGGAKDATGEGGAVADV